MELFATSEADRTDWLNAIAAVVDANCRCACIQRVHLFACDFSAANVPVMAGELDIPWPRTWKSGKQAGVYGAYAMRIIG